MLGGSSRNARWTVLTALLVVYSAVLLLLLSLSNSYAGEVVVYRWYVLPCTSDAIYRFVPFFSL